MDKLRVTAGIGAVQPGRAELPVRNQIEVTPIAEIAQSARIRSERQMLRAELAFDLNRVQAAVVAENRGRAVAVSGPVCQSRFSSRRMI